MIFFDERDGGIIVDESVENMKIVPPFRIVSYGNCFVDDMLCGDDSR